MAQAKANISYMKRASMIFLSQQVESAPVLKRPIFWVFSISFTAYFAACLALAVLFFGAVPDNGVPEYRIAYSSATVPPTSWGQDINGNPCPFGGCTVSPTKLPTVSNTMV